MESIKPTRSAIVEIENLAGGQWADCEALITHAVRAAIALSGESRRCAVYVQLTDDPTIHRINRETRGVDRPTDVLSFPLSAPGWEEIDPQSGALMLGDLIISMQRARQQAAEYGHSLAREAAYLAAHGTLHLLGHDHEQPDEKRRMRALEEAAMARLGLTHGTSGGSTGGEGHAQTQPER